MSESRPGRGAAALRIAAENRHRRFGRRRQVHPDRPAALRLQGRDGGPARGCRADLAGTRQRLHRPRAGDRRAALRAGAGHHHRRRLPLLRHGQAEIHHRRHPGPHPVHPQHGHRNLDRAAGDRARRRPPRAVGAVPPARLPGFAARRAACGARGQQDGSDRLGRGALQLDSRRVPRVRRPAGHPRRHHHSDVGAQRRQRGHQVRQGPLVRRAATAEPPRGRLHRRRPQPRRRALPGPVRDPAADPRARRPSQLRGHRRQRCAAPRRRGRGAAERKDQSYHGDRRSDRPGGRGVPADGGVDQPGRRHRHLPR